MGGALYLYGELIWGFRMIFWLISAVTGLVVASILALPLLRRTGEGTGREANITVYRDQLTTLDADVERGAVNADEAETTRIELSRRLIAAGAMPKADRRDAPAKVDRLAVIVTALVVLGGGAAAYYTLGSPGRPDAPLATRIAEARATRDATERPPQSVVEAMMAAQATTRELSERDAALIAQLAAVVAARPADLEGRRLLARSYMQLGRYLEGKQIQAEVVALAGEAAEPDDLSALAEFMIVAAGGYVSPEAEALLNRTLSITPDDPWAQYYLGRTRAQTGDLDAAREIFETLAQNDNTPGDLRAAVREDLSIMTGPGAADIEAASQMDEGAQREMIEGMVAGLGERLNAEGGSASEWARLIRAYGVLGRDADADAALAEARAIFAGNATALAILDSAR